MLTDSRLCLVRCSFASIRLSANATCSSTSGYTRGKQQSSEQDLENQNDDQLSALGAKISALRGVRHPLPLGPSSPSTDPDQADFRPATA